MILAYEDEEPSQKQQEMLARMHTLHYNNKRACSSKARAIGGSDDNRGQSQRERRSIFGRVGERNVGSINEILHGRSFPKYRAAHAFIQCVTRGIHNSVRNAKGQRRG